MREAAAGSTTYTYTPATDKASKRLLKQAITKRYPFGFTAYRRPIIIAATIFGLVKQGNFFLRFFVLCARKILPF